MQDVCVSDKWEVLCEALCVSARSVCITVRDAARSRSGTITISINTTRPAVPQPVVRGVALHGENQVRAVRAPTRL